MKSTAIGMIIVLLILMGLALFQGTHVFKAALSNSMHQLIKFLPVLVIVMLIAGFTETLLPKNLVENWLSDASGWRGIAIAWIGGIITPGGSIVGLPIIATLFNAGVGTAVLMTYATSLATLSMLRIPLEVGFYGWKLTLLRIGVSLILPLIAGGLTLLATRIWEIR